MGQITLDDIIKKQTCPICGKTVNEVRAWSACPKYRKPVCMKHCYNGCQHLGERHCNYKDEKNTLPLPWTVK